MRDKRQADSAKANANALQALGCDKYDWYMVQTAPQREWVSHSIITDLGFPAFLPIRVAHRRPNRHTEKRKMRFPLIPRSLFIGFIPGHEAWLTLHHANACSGVVSLQGTPRALPSAIVHGFLYRIGAEVDAPNYERYMRTRAEYAVGDTVRVVDGPLSGHLVEVTDIRGPRAFAIIEAFTGQKPVEFQTGNLERV